MGETPQLKVTWWDGDKEEWVDGGVFPVPTTLETTIYIHTSKEMVYVKIMPAGDEDG